MSRTTRRPHLAPAPNPRPDKPVDWQAFAKSCFDNGSRMEDALIRAEALTWALQHAVNASTSPTDLPAGAVVVLADCLADAIAEGLESGVESAAPGALPPGGEVKQGRG